MGDVLKIVKTIEGSRREVERVEEEERQALLAMDIWDIWELYDLRDRTLPNDPISILKSFGYKTFDYTKGKELADFVIAPEARVQELLFGRLLDRQESSPESAEST